MKITKRALFQRVARAFEKDGRKLVVNRREGGWSVIELERNVRERDIDDLEPVARSMKLLQEWEAVER